MPPHAAQPKPFVWTAPADTIIAKVNRRKHLLESIREQVRSAAFSATRPAARGVEGVA